MTLKSEKEGPPSCKLIESVVDCTNLLPCLNYGEIWYLMLIGLSRKKEATCTLHDVWKSEGGSVSAHPVPNVQQSRRSLAVTS